jgi:hypothetical protein
LAFLKCPETASPLKLALRFNSRNMAPNRDWVDYANLASNLAQNVQLGGIKDRLFDLQDIAASQAQEARRARRAIEQAEKRAERIAKHREVVVQGEKALAGLRHHLRENPLAVMALALAYKHSYKENGLGTDCFESFDDKDRAERFLSGLDEIGEAAAEKLTPEQQNDAKLSLQYRLEEDDLKHLVEVQKHREQEVAEQAKRVRELQPEIIELKSQIEALRPKVREAEEASQTARETIRVRAAERISAFLGFLAALSGVTFVGSLLCSFFDLSPARLNTVTQVIICSALLTGVLGIAAKILASLYKESGKDTVQYQMADLQSRLIIYEASASMQTSPLSDKDRALYERFGGSPETSSSEYERMLAVRQALIASVFSDSILRGPAKAGLGTSTPLDLPV